MYIFQYLSSNQLKKYLPVDPFSYIVIKSDKQVDICKLIGTHLRVVWSASK